MQTGKVLEGLDGSRDDGLTSSRRLSAYEGLVRFMLVWVFCRFVAYVTDGVEVEPELCREKCVSR